MRFYTLSIESDSFSLSVVNLLWVLDPILGLFLALSLEKSFQVVSGVCFCGRVVRFLDGFWRQDLFSFSLIIAKHRHQQGSVLHCMPLFSTSIFLNLWSYIYCTYPKMKALRGRSIRSMSYYLKFKCFVFAIMNNWLYIVSDSTYCCCGSIFCMIETQACVKLSETVKNAPRVSPHHLVSVHHWSVLLSQSLALYPAIKVWWAPLKISLFLAELKLSDRESDSVTFSLAVR